MFILSVLAFLLSMFVLYSIISRRNQLQKIMEQEQRFQEAERRRRQTAVPGSIYDRIKR